MADRGPLRPSWEDSVRLDLYYVENWSITGDVIILYRTARSVARARRRLLMGADPFVQAFTDLHVYADAL